MQRCVFAMFGVLTVSGGGWGSASAQTVSANADLYVVQVAVDPRKASGQPWDGDGSGPEVRLAVITPGGRQAVPGRCPDTLACRFDRVYFPRGAVLRIEDEDLMANDLIGSGPCEVSSQVDSSCRLGSAVATFTPIAVHSERIAEAQHESSRARELSTEQIRALLIRRSVSLAGSSSTWTFEPAEPFSANIEVQRTEGDLTIASVFIRTNSIDGRTPASGLIEVRARWANGNPALVAALSRGFQLETDVAASESFPPNTEPTNSDGADFDANIVVIQIRARLTAIRRCYEVELRTNPRLSGRVTAEFTIEESGRVSNAWAQENTTGSAAVEACVLDTVGRFRFNPGPRGGSVRFSYPFVFQPVRN